MSRSHRAHLPPVEHAARRRAPPVDRRAEALAEDAALRGLDDLDDEILDRVLRTAGLEPAGVRRSIGLLTSARAWRDPDEAERLGHRRTPAASPAP